MKLISPNRAFLTQLTQYLVWLAPACIVAGLTVGFVTGGWGVLPITLILIGVALLLAWLFLAENAQTFWRKRSTQAGTNALVATLALLIALGAVNFLATRYNSRVDLTENQIFTLAPQTQDLLRDLNQPVKVWVFTPNPSAADRQLLDNYRRTSNQFSYEFVDPQAKPGLAQEFGVKAVGEVYLEMGDKRRLVQTLSPQNPQDRLSERRLTNGLAQILQNATQKVYFLQGHGERSLEPGQGAFSQVKTRLGEESFVAEPLNLTAAAKVPEDANVVVIAGAQRPLLPAELTALKDFQTRKSGLMVLVDPQTDPQLDSLLREWGVTPDNRLVTDPAGETSGLGAGVVIVNQYGEHPITRGFNNGISFYPLVRPLKIAPVTGIQAAPLLITDKRTTAQVIAADGSVQTDGAAPTGPFDIGAAFSRTVEPVAVAPSPSPSPAPSPSPSPAGSTASPSPSPKPSPSPSPAADETESEARLVVIGSSSFATDGLFDQQLNSDVFLNSVSWLSQRDDDVLSIRPKEVTNRRIVMSMGQQMSAALMALLFLPLLAFGGAALIWWKRR